jgi:hypothetical protein
VLVYVDDLLHISHGPKKLIQVLQNKPYEYRLKDLGQPERYLGAKIGQFYIEADKVNTWYIPAEAYLEKAIPIIGERFGKLDTLFSKSRLDALASHDFHPGVDTSNFMRGNDITLYQSHIGIIQWAIELGRIDITHAGSTMAKFTVAPREGHLAAVVRIFAYIKKHLHFLTYHYYA